MLVLIVILYHVLPKLVTSSVSGIRMIDTTDFPGLFFIACHQIAVSVVVPTRLLLVDYRRRKPVAVLICSPFRDTFGWGCASYPVYRVKGQPWSAGTNL